MGRIGSGITGGGWRLGLKIRLGFLVTALCAACHL
jgi:hypothetical protein